MKIKSGSEAASALRSTAGSSGGGKRRIAALIMACSIWIGAAAAPPVVTSAPVAADVWTSKAEGGVWTHGTDLNPFVLKVWSHYYHGSRPHRSTACSPHGCSYSGGSRRVWFGGGAIAKANHRANILGGNKAYYDVR